MEKVFICSPYRGAEEKNVRLAAGYARFAYERGYLPIAPHLYFPQFLRDYIPKERMTGMELGLALMGECKEVWVFGEHISEGMLMEISYADRHRIPVRYFRQAPGGFMERRRTDG